MPRPTREQILRACRVGGDAVVSLFEAWDSDGETERQRGRAALEIVSKWHCVHDQHCRYWQTVGECDCGLKEALALVGARRAPSPAASWEDVTPSEPEEVERYNELQRARRKAFAEGMEEAGDIFEEDPTVRAARRYPLKKRVPKVIPDPHYPASAKGQWRAAEAIGAGHLSFEFHSAVAGWVPAHEAQLHWTQARARALAALLDDPWEIVDDTSVEEL